MEQNKTREQLLETVYSQRVTINKLQVDLDKEREQVKAIIDDVMPIVDEIKQTNKFLGFIKIVKLAFVLVNMLIKHFKTNKDAN